MNKDTFIRHLQALAAGETQEPAAMIYAGGVVGTAFYPGDRASLVKCVESRDSTPDMLPIATAIIRVNSTPNILEFLIGGNVQERMGALRIEALKRGNLSLDASSSRMGALRRANFSPESSLLEDLEEMLEKCLPPEPKR
jgi:hypothetical protein